MVQLIVKLKKLLKIKETSEAEGEGNYTKMHLEDQAKFHWDPIKKKYVIEG
jgi:hypothetical protein